MTPNTTPAPASTLAATNNRPAPPAKTPQPEPQPIASLADDDTFPKYPASERPVRRWDRIAWQLWVICVLLTVAITLIFFLIDKISPIIKRWL
jgi:hypothetical protein